MSDILDWSDLCPQTVVWQPLTGRDRYGAPSYGVAQTFRGRRVFKAVRTAKDAPGGSQGQGAEVISSSQIWILGTPAVKYDDLVYISGDDVTKVPPVLNIQNTPDEEGELYVKVLLGSFNG